MCGICGDVRKIQSGKFPILSSEKCLGPREKLSKICREESGISYRAKNPISLEGNVMIPNKDTLGYLTLWLWKNKQRNP